MIAQLLNMYRTGPRITDCGKYLPWYDYRQNAFRRLQIDARSFPTGCDPEKYWERLLPGIFWGWGYVIDGGDFPISPQALAQAAESYPLAENIEEALNAAHNLLDEAVTNKLGTIPPRALVEVPLGPFAYVELTERLDGVHIVLRTKDWMFDIADIEPTKHAHVLAVPGSSFGVSEELRNRIDAGVFLLLCAIIRDFWVIEKRESVFDYRVERERRSGRRSEPERPRVVYLPRIRYTQRPNIEKCSSALDHRERRAHWVRAHLRRVVKASQHQVILAERYGFDVPKGYTFVSPHERGKKKRDVIYRSRSALRCLYTVVPKGTAAKPARWFQFERDVHDLMKALGFEVEHVAASRKADNGVDVYATKGRDLDEVQWVIQCKCWGRKRKVSPSTVRDIVGALTHYPPGTREMIVTTSGFTSGAIKEAERNGIRTMDGEEFVELVQQSRNNECRDSGSTFDP